MQAAGDIGRLAGRRKRRFDRAVLVALPHSCMNDNTVLKIENGYDFHGKSLRGAR